jgi:hypothetical protein
MERSACDHDDRDSLNSGAYDRAPMAVRAVAHTEPRPSTRRIQHFADGRHMRGSERKSAQANSQLRRGEGRVSRLVSCLRLSSTPAPEKTGSSHCPSSAWRTHCAMHPKCRRTWWRKLVVFSAGEERVEGSPTSLAVGGKALSHCVCGRISGAQTRAIASHGRTRLIGGARGIRTADTIVP